LDILVYTKSNMPERITTNPKIMVGKPIIKNTRITVELILRQLAQGKAIQDLLTEYPHLQKEDIFATKKYAAVRI
jgi:uncharacterized protein (DUF433 family)